MKIDKLHLMKKGWSAKEIEHASNIVSKAEDKKYRGIKFLDKTSYSVILILLVITNALCSALFIPFMFAVKSDFIIAIVIILGFAFGVFFSKIILDLQKLEKKHLSWLVVTLILSGILNYFLISTISIKFSNLTGLVLLHNPYLIAGIYLFAFLVPHAVLIIHRP